MAQRRPFLEFISSCLALVAITLLAPAKTLGSEAIRCGDKLYSLGYALTKSHQPFGSFFSEIEAQPDFFALKIAYLAVLAKGAPSLQDDLALFFDNQYNESDFSRPIIWQANDLHFPSSKTPVSSLPGLAPECLIKGSETVEIFTLAKVSKLGDIKIIDYDRALVAELKQSRLQHSFYNMSVFLLDFAKSRKSSARIEALFHSQNLMYLSEEKLHDEFSENLKFSSNIGYCNLSIYLVKNLQRELGIPCDEMIPRDLLEVQKLQLVGDGFDSLPLTNLDFVGLFNLKKLSISHFRNELRSLDAGALLNLGQLEELHLTDIMIDETPKNFMEGPYHLKTLDLSKNNIREFKRNAFRQVMVQGPTDGDVRIDLSQNTANSSPRPQVYVHPGTFDNCQAVTELNMQDMNLRVLNFPRFDGHFSSI